MSIDGSPGVVLCDPVTDPSWDDRVRSFSGYTVFHCRAWLRCLEEAYRYRSLGIVVDSEPGVGEPGGLAVVAEVRSALTGTRAVALPFSDSCPVLARYPDARQRAGDSLLAAAADRRWREIGLRGAPAGDVVSAADPTFLSHSIWLGEGIDGIDARMSSSFHRNARKAERAGYEVAFSTDSHALESFVTLNRLSRREHGLPPQPDRFFRSLNRHLLQAGLGELAVAYAHQRAVSAMMFLWFGDALIYKYGASLPGHAPSASHLLMREATCRYRERGFRNLWLGRCSVANEGLRRFKRAAGAEESNLVYYRGDPCLKSWHAEPPRPEGRYRDLVRRMPLALLRLAGRIAYRHAG